MANRSTRKKSEAALEARVTGELNRVAAVARVRENLKAYVPRRQLGPGPFTAYFGAGSRGGTLVALGGVELAPRFSFLRADFDGTVSGGELAGVILGFNTEVVDAVRALMLLGRISEDERDAFIAAFRAAQAEASHESRCKNAVSALEEEGYHVVLKKKRAR